MPQPKKPYFGAKRRRATRADGTKTRRVHHGALGVRRSQPTEIVRGTLQLHTSSCACIVQRHNRRSGCTKGVRASRWPDRVGRWVSMSALAIGRVSVRALRLQLLLCGATAGLWQEKALKERLRADWLEKKARLEHNKEVKQIAQLSYSPAAWGLADRPVDEDDEAAVLGQLTRETAPLDPSLPALTDLEGALAESVRLAKEKKLEKECCVCFEEHGDALFTLNCHQSRGKHKMCSDCIVAEKNKVHAAPETGVVVRFQESWWQGHEVERKGLACKCPICRQPFLSAWSPFLRRPVGTLVQRLPIIA